MSSHQTFSEQLIMKFTCTPEPDDIDQMTKDISPAQPSTIRRVSVLSSLGQLDIFPPELLLHTLDCLDFQSLSRISRTSFKGKEMVEAVLAYRDMMTHAPKVLAALGTTRLISYHSASLLRQALRSNKCVSCSNFTSVLFLPTCERVCVPCMHRDQSFWMMTTKKAKQSFGLTDTQLKRIPILHNVKVEYPRREDYHLVSVKQARQLGIEVHGSNNVFEATTRGTWILPANIRIPYLTAAGTDYGRACATKSRPGPRPGPSVGPTAVEIQGGFSGAHQALQWCASTASGVGRRLDQDIQTMV